MKELNKILEGIAFKLIQGKLETNINAIQTDSRKIQKGDCFVAIKGLTTDGHSYINNVLEQQCNAIICEQKPKDISENVTIILVEDTSKILGHLASNYFDNPQSKLEICGITGTNGKTTCVNLLYDLFTQQGYNCGLISTIEIKINGRVKESSHTTPDALILHGIFKEMVDDGCTTVFMEVSSHAIHQHRIGAVNFNVAAFTNISHDHLNYHGSFKEYIRVKKLFFDELSSDALAITNADDKNGAVMLQNSKALKKNYALMRIADYKGKILDQTIEGLHLAINNVEAHFKICGQYNAYNILLVIAVAEGMGLNFQEALQTLTMLSTASGRLEKVAVVDNDKIAFVDYAHTPDALKNVLETLVKLRRNGQRIITVVGCGGDRDKTKRPKMAKVASRLSELAIFTSDNPRTEDPQSILNDMAEGLQAELLSKTITIVDRKQAIKTAVMMANNNDIILVAGKGHEKYQDINGVKTPFDDKEVIKQLLAN